MSKIQKFSAEIGGREMAIEVGKFAHQTDGACTVQYGDTVVLGTACMSNSIREGIDFFPLLVDFDEKLYAAGKIKGSRFIKREGRASDEAILSARLTDRAIRPLFDSSIKNDVQMVLTVLSFDAENDADVLGLNAASVALAISDIPWNGPVAAVRVGRIESENNPGNYEWVLNPTYEAREKSDLDFVIVAKNDEFVMFEAGGKEVDEDSIEQAIEFGLKHIRKTIKLIDEVVSKVGKEKRTLVSETDKEEKIILEKIQNKVEQVAANKIDKIFESKDKADFYDRIKKIKDEVESVLKEDNEVSKDERAKGGNMVDEQIEVATKKLVLEKNKRVDGRKMDEVRDLSAEVGILPRTHGSGLFQRGETQVLSVVTLGPPSDEQQLDTMEESGKKRYMHHYNFPGFSVGEVKPNRGPSRRDIGHGALAEKALLPMLPDKEKFPYTIRVVSEVLSSNGSSSQASACGSSLALMDAGVPILKPVAGLAMGLITDEKDKKNYKILTDIQGVEDHSGDMDFKVAGTSDGITAIQLDIKLDGISMDAVRDALREAKKGRLEILDVMNKAISQPREKLSEYAPKIYSLKIDPDKIRTVIGPGGKMINEIIDKTGVQIDIEDDGSVFVTTVSEENANKAIEWIENLTHEVKAGEDYQAKVTRLMDFGAFAEILPGQEGLIHISEMAPFRVDKVTDVINEGDTVPVKVKEIDDRGRINLTMLGTDFDFSTIKPSSSPIAPRGGFNSRPPRSNGPRRPFNNSRR